MENKKEIYYYANHIYQFSYALPVYNKIGGVFVVKDLSRYLQFKRHFRNLAKFSENTIFNTPRVIISPRERLHELKGIIFFLANSIVPDKDYSGCKTIFHEHGTSDKRYGGKAHEEAKSKLKKYDFIFLSGPKNKKRLEEVGLLFPSEKLVKIGGLRFGPYFNRELSILKEQNRLKIKDFTRKNILYAPTWRFGKGTLPKYGLKFAREITHKYNLIIRPHFHDFKYCRKLKLLAKLHNLRHLYFSNNPNTIKYDTFNDFILADLMISDMSSVIYEFLILGKPMIIVKNEFTNFHKMPKRLDIMQNVDVYDENQDIIELIDSNLLEHKYKETYAAMAEECFYLNDDSVNRAVKFIERLRKEN